MVANNAGKPATPADLINVDEVIGKYYDLVPDPAVPEQRVIFGTSGHRGSSMKTSVNEAHIVAITQAIAEYRKKAGVTGPLYLGRDTHALSGPAEKTAIEVLVANGVHVRVDSPTTLEQKAKFAKLTGDDVAATQLAGEDITAKLTEAPGNHAKIGGLKVTTKDNWFAARPSGTENIYKVYAESFVSPEALDKVLDEAKLVVDKALGE